MRIKHARHEGPLSYPHCARPAQLVRAGPPRRRARARRAAFACDERPRGSAPARRRRARRLFSPAPYSALFGSGVSLSLISRSLDLDLTIWRSLPPGPRRQRRRAPARFACGRPGARFGDRFPRRRAQALRRPARAPRGRPTIKRPRRRRPHAAAAAARPRAPACARPRRPAAGAVPRGAPGPHSRRLPAPINARARRGPGPGRPQQLRPGIPAGARPHSPA